MRRLIAIGILALGVPGAVAAQPAAKVTVLYDAFGNPSDLKRDCGLRCLPAITLSRSPRWESVFATCVWRSRFKN